MKTWGHSFTWAKEKKRDRILQSSWWLTINSIFLLWQIVFCFFHCWIYILETALIPTRVSVWCRAELERVRILHLHRLSKGSYLEQIRSQLLCTHLYNSHIHSTRMAHTHSTHGTNRQALISDSDETLEVLFIYLFIHLFILN